MAEREGGEKYIGAQRTTRLVEVECISTVELDILLIELRHTQLLMSS